MRIVMAAPTAIPARRANTVQVMKMAQALTAIGHQVYLLSPMPEGVSRDDLPSWDQLADHYGLETRFSITWLNARVNLRRYDYSISAMSYARRLGCDLYYTRLIQSAAFTSLAGIPTLLEVHDLPGGRMGPVIFKLFLRGRGARRLAVITKALAADMLQNLGIPPAGTPQEGAFTVIVPDGVDLKRFANLPSAFQARQQVVEIANAFTSLKPEAFTAGYTGHLYKGRGIPLLFRLASRLPTIQFLLVGGEAKDVERLRREAESQGLANLFLTGFIPNAVLPRYQAACDVLLMPYEMQVSASSGGDIAPYLSPMKLFEYMACERVILSSDLPVLREVLNPQNALLLPPQDVDAWTAALQMLQADPNAGSQIARQAGQDVQRYTWEERAIQLIQGLQRKP